MGRISSAFKLYPASYDIPSLSEELKTALAEKPAEEARAARAPA